ncbi:MAG: IclR family transcriptional regulator [Sphingobium sp.]
MGDKDSGTGTLGKALTLLAAIVRDSGKRPLTAIAEEIGLPRATAHRTAQALQHMGYLIRSRRGYYHAGPALAALTPGVGPAAVATGIARPVLAQLAAQEDCLAHLGIFEQDMVTYLLKEGVGKEALFTRQNMQMEAYCSGLGKVLLAGLDEEALETYLANGPFIALTPNTLVEPAALREEIARVRRQGFAIDNCEVDENLFCIAAPLFDPSGRVFAAVSLSFPRSAIDRDGWRKHLSALQEGMRKIMTRMTGSGESPARSPEPPPAPALQE